MIEEEYAKSMIKLVQCQLNDGGKKGYFTRILLNRTFGENWNQFLSLHEKIASVHMKLAFKVSELGDGLNGLYKDTERSRKQVISRGVIVVEICWISSCKTFAGD